MWTLPSCARRRARDSRTIPTCSRVVTGVSRANQPTCTCVVSLLHTRVVSRHARATLKKKIMFTKTSIYVGFNLNRGGFSLKPTSEVLSKVLSVIRVLHTVHCTCTCKHLPDFLGQVKVRFGQVF